MAVQSRMHLSSGEMNEINLGQTKQGNACDHRNKVRKSHDAQSRVVEESEAIFLKLLEPGTVHLKRVNAFKTIARDGSLELLNSRRVHVLKRFPQCFDQPENHRRPAAKGQRKRDW